MCIRDSNQAVYVIKLITLCISPWRSASEFGENYSTACVLSARCSTIGLEPFQYLWAPLFNAANDCLVEQHGQPADTEEEHAP